MRFGVFELDPRTGELRKHGVRIKLQDQPFAVLLMLLEKPGQLVTREELQQRLWPADTFVEFDKGIYNAMSVSGKRSATVPKLLVTSKRYRNVAIALSREWTCPFFRCNVHRRDLSEG